MSIYTGKTALVTGSRGIAEAIIKNLHAKGANVIVVSVSASCQKLVDQLQPNEGRAIAIQSNLSSASAASELVAKVVKGVKDAGWAFHAEGKLVDFVIPCAGIMPMATLAKVDEKTWNDVFSVNVVGPVFLVKELTPFIANDGRIVFFSSSLTYSSGLPPAYLPYVATKGAIEQTVRALAKDPDLTSRGISTSAISPGPTATELFFDGKPEAMLNALKGANPFGRFGTPEDIAEAVDAVLAPRGSWFNGANLRSNGGTMV